MKNLLVRAGDGGRPLLWFYLRQRLMIMSSQINQQQVKTTSPVFSPQPNVPIKMRFRRFQKSSYNQSIERIRQHAKNWKKPKTPRRGSQRNDGEFATNMKRSRDPYSNERYHPVVVSAF
ncbi:hypothetical protein O9992_23045 [Vibrio lentus]|nr:hypothetical protein [Vibrio lentus]